MPEAQRVFGIQRNFHRQIFGGDMAAVSVSINCRPGLFGVAFGAMKRERSRVVISFIVAISFIFGTILMPMMAASKAVASTRSEQTIAGQSGNQCFLSSICPAHNNRACFQCAHAMQHSSPLAIFSDQGLLSVYYPSPQVAFLSWIKVIDPKPPRHTSSI